MPDRGIGRLGADPAPDLGKSDGAMSIRTFLTLVIAVMGIALLAVVGTRMVTDAERSARARDVVTLAELGQSLLPALISSRIERGTIVVASMAEAPADDASWQRLAVHRPVADAMIAQSVAALKSAPIPDAAALARQLTESHDRLVAIRPTIDAALRLPRTRRDANLITQYGAVSADAVNAISVAAEAVERATILFDPRIDRLIYLNRAVSAVRNYTSLITLRMESAVAFNLPWRDSDVIAAAEDRGRADLAWSSVLSLAGEPGIPDALEQQIAAVKAVTDGPEGRRQAAIIADLQQGRRGEISVSELQQLDTGLLDPLNSVLKESMTQMVAAATRYRHQARVSVAATGALLFVIFCLTGLGLAVVHQRVSQPIRRITRQMSRLKDADLSLGHDDAFAIEDAKRHDEIGEMARALIAFRQQVEDRGRRLQEHEMQRFLETLIDAMPVGISFKDTDLRYRFVNRARRDALGDDPQVGKRLSEVASGETVTEIETVEREILASGVPRQFEQAYVLPNGGQTIIWSLKTPFRDADGTIRGIITCGVDITRLKQVEAELLGQREKADAANRAKSAFLGSMSHELRTPLNAIIGFADMLANGYLGVLGGRQLEYVRDIRKSGEHLLKMVNDLLDLSNLEIGRQVLDIADCSFDQVATAALSMVQPQADQANILLDFTPTALSLRADERALTQILVNLLGNAIKFSPPGGRIALRALRQSDGIRIQVEDDGLGMTEVQRINALTATLAATPHAADPYKARPKGGAGLGLAICRRLIEQHHGTLEIESETGRGSTVNVVLPAA